MRTNRFYDHICLPISSDNRLDFISEIRIEFHQVQQCFSNKIKPLHVSVNDGHHWKATKTRRTEHTHNTDGLLWRNTTITGIHSKISTNWNILLILTNQFNYFKS
jgi:hypothetical protein